MLMIFPFSIPIHRFLLRRRDSSRIDAQLAVPNHLLNLTLLLQVIQCLPCETSIDLQSIDERGDGDQAVRLDVFVEFVGGGFVEDDGVVGFVLNCALTGTKSARLEMDYDENNIAGSRRGVQVKI